MSPCCQCDQVACYPLPSAAKHGSCSGLSHPYDYLFQLGWIIKRLRIIQCLSHLCVFPHWGSMSNHLAGVPWQIRFARTLLPHVRSAPPPNSDPADPVLSRPLASPMQGLEFVWRLSSCKIPNAMKTPHGIPKKTNARNLEATISSISTIRLLVNQ